MSLQREKFHLAFVLHNYAQFTLQQSFRQDRSKINIHSSNYLTLGG